MKIPGEDNPSDLFTKALGIVKFRKFADMLEQGAIWLTESGAAACAKQFEDATTYMALRMYDF